jgi:hypothetical protein
MAFIVIRIAWMTSSPTPAVAGLPPNLNLSFGRDSGENQMLGIDDPFVLMAYLGAISMAVLGLIYGLVRRNAARDEVTAEDRLWALDEKKVDDEF